MQAELENTVKQLNLDNNKLKYENQQLDDTIHKKRDNLSETIEQNKQISELAFNDYIDNLDNRYNQVEKEFDYKIDSLREQLSDVTMELDKMKKTRAAAHEAIAKKQFPLILQDKTKCGIYKITNLITDECYIGQSNDIYRRWSDHCKCGLGIDTPVGNKLYKAIQEYGLENFTFELLIECSQSELNSKEKYFIELYQSDTYGYNGNIGINK